MLGATFAVTHRITVLGVVGYRELLGSAEDSPIVKAGDSSQMIVGLSVGYRF